MSSGSKDLLDFFEHDARLNIAPIARRRLQIFIFKQEL